MKQVFHIIAGMGLAACTALMPWVPIGGDCTHDTECSADAECLVGVCHVEANEQPCREWEGLPCIHRVTRSALSPCASAFPGVLVCDGQRTQCELRGPLLEDCDNGCDDDLDDAVDECLPDGCAPTVDLAPEDGAEGSYSGFELFDDGVLVEAAPGRGGYGEARWGESGNDLRPSTVSSACPLPPAGAGPAAYAGRAAVFNLISQSQGRYRVGLELTDRLYGGAPTAQRVPSTVVVDILLPGGEHRRERVGVSRADSARPSVYLGDVASCLTLPPGTTRIIAYDYEAEACPCDTFVCDDWMLFAPKRLTVVLVR